MLALLDQGTHTFHGAIWFGKGGAEQVQVSRTDDAKGLGRTTSVIVYASQPGTRRFVPNSRKRLRAQTRTAWRVTFRIRGRLAACRMKGSPEMGRSLAVRPRHDR